MSFLNTRKCYKPPIQTLSSQMQVRSGTVAPPALVTPSSAGSAGQKSPWIFCLPLRVLRARVDVAHLTLSTHAEYTVLFPRSAKGVTPISDRTTRQTRAILRRFLFLWTKDKEPKKGKSALDAVSTHLCFLSATRPLCPCSFLITECSFHYRFIDFKCKDKELLSLYCRTEPTLDELWCWRCVTGDGQAYANFSCISDSIQIKCVLSCYATSIVNAWGL